MMAGWRGAVDDASGNDDDSLGGGGGGSSSASASAKSSSARAGSKARQNTSNNSTTSNSTAPAFDVKIFCDTVNSLCANLNLKRVIAKLDYRGFAVHELRGFSLIVSAFRRGAGGNEVFPLGALLQPQLWANREAQFAMLAFALHPASTHALGAHTFAAHAHAARKLVAHTDGLVHVAKLPPALQEWTSLELLETLLALAASTELVARVRATLMSPAVHCPDLLLLALLQDW